MARVLLEDHSSSTDDIKRCMHSLRFTAGTVRIKTFLLPSGWQGRWGRWDECTRGKCECAERGKQQGARSKGGNSPHSSCCCVALPPEVLLLFALALSEQLMGQKQLMLQKARASNLKDTLIHWLRMNDNKSWVDEMPRFLTSMFWSHSLRAGPTLRKISNITGTITLFRNC